MNIDEEYFKSEEFQELLSSYEESLETGNTPFLDVDDLVDLADYYNYTGDIDRAAEIVDDALELYPNDTLLNVFKARQALVDFDFDAAQGFADAIEDREAPDYHYLVAEITIARGHIDEADRYLRDLFLTMPADEVLDYVKDVANLYVDYGVYDKSYEWMLRSPKDDSDDFKELMARSLVGVGRYKEAQQLFNELLDHNPYSTLYWNALASAQFMDEDYSGAVTSCGYALAIDPEAPESQLTMANGLMQLGNYEEAADYYQRYLQQAPDDANAYVMLGHVWLSMGKVSDALPMFQAAVVCAPSDDQAIISAAHAYMALCYLENGQRGYFLLNLEKAAANRPDEARIILGHLFPEGMDPAEYYEYMLKKLLV